MNSRLSIIVLPRKFTPVEKSAAEELAFGLIKVTRTSFEVVSEDKVCGRRAFYIGATELGSRLALADGISKWKDDEIYIRSVEEGIVLAGDSVRGPLYAVCTYLEEFLGVRWWTATESFYPHLSVVDIPNVNLRFAPALKYREPYYLVGFDPKLKVRSKVNYSSVARYEPATPKHPFIPAEMGGNYRLYFFTGRRSAYHSFFEILPPDKYFEEHPEWYSLIDGKRVAKQLCLSNEEMTEAYISETLRRLREAPDVNFIQVSQNDWNGACECDACRTIEAEEGGAHSGSYLRFVNRVAEAVEKEFPNVMIDTFAYQFTRSAPAKVKPRRNVVVRLCDIECAFNRPLNEFDVNKAFLKDLEDWSYVAPGQLFLWDYMANFRSYMLPHPNIYSIAPNIRRFVKSGAVGVFEQGDGGCAAGEFASLRFWLTAHLLWDPECDEKKLMHEFICGYYGIHAAPHIEKYISLLNSVAAASEKPMSCYHANITDWVPENVIDDAVAEMDMAISEAGRDGTEYVYRVRREQLSTDHLRIVNWKPEDGDRTEFIQRWAESCREYGVCTAAETTNPNQLDEYVEKLLGTSR